jgi:hypothetical protein
MSDFCSKYAMNFRSTLAACSTGVELRAQPRRKRLLVDQLEHLPPAHKPIRPVLIGNRQYLRALRAMEMRAWEAGVQFWAE